MKGRQDYKFTSESVGEGHPDKVCDQISDAILDEALRQDPHSRVACECFTTTGMVLVGGEITTKGYIDIREVTKKVLSDIGYNKSDYGLDYNSCAIISSINEQSPDISQGVTEGVGLHKEMGAGDQGMMFGYACKDTPELMPAPVQFSHRIMQKAAEVRKNGTIPYLRPDGKCQVTVEYKNGVPNHIDTVVLSHQHHDVMGGDKITLELLRKDLIEKVIKDVLPSELFSDKTIFHINPTGRFVIGGPQGDAGLTGRKIIVDTYGGKAAHGGGAFSGKDPSKVDRSAAYMARYVAKNIVAAGIADQCEVELAYAIGVAEPVSVYVNTYGTSDIAEDKIEEGIRKVFDLTPRGIITTLDLLKPIYLPTASYGHFGRDIFSWEATDKVSELQKVLL
ncbi:methionine adenosyltransferase [Spirochaeta cellobiosiphila]|uniref:methionine adenosyltransferase n=1 Tax=Spirochaeta cellobiosiphila TaxID=504483 RepID=UPI00041366EC|nr:methionine adenosyltransferase [Spirochaeta cellobiosiphila]